jgi:site-specific recombinase XerD
MQLPEQTELQTLFSGFLFEAGLSAVSVKNYLSDLRHFLAFCASISTEDTPPSVQEVFQSISKYVNLYTDEQRRSFTPQNTVNRRLASIRRFSTFLSTQYGLQTGTETLSVTSKSAFSHVTDAVNNDTASLPTISKILEHFKLYLVKEKKTHSTIKNYVSDLNHFFAWSANDTPFLDQNLENILSELHLNTYVTYLRLSHISTSVINRRQSSIKKFAKYCFLQKYLPTNPFENIQEVPHLAPLSWFERFTTKNKASKKASNNRLAILYRRYNALPFTPYLHLAILVLATSAMVIFGYNQIIKQASPSSAAVPTTPRRQLSFQGRLTDSSGTPIVTSVNVVFKLWNALTSGTQLYTSNTCTITPDQNGIFNTLIGDGTCGQEIASTVFTENRDVYLEITVGSETLTPRQQIATVGYALNSETLQGYPASSSATVNTIPVVDGSGNINIAASSPSIISASGTFTVKGQALTLSTAVNSGGNIVLQPDAIGGGQVQVLGATTNTDTLNIQNANLTSGNLISGYVGNNTATGNLLSLSSGSTQTNRFYVNVNGQTAINTASTLANAALKINQNGTGDLFTASSSGVTKFTIANNGNITATGTLTGLTGLTVNSGAVSLPTNSIGNSAISELDWTKLQNYPTACPAGQAVQAVGDTLTCVSIGGTQLWQEISGALSPQNITDSLNLGSTATSSALVHFTGTAGNNSFINTGNFGIGTANPNYSLDVNSGSNSSVANFKSNQNDTYIWLENSTGGIPIMASGSNFSVGNDSLEQKFTIDVSSGNVGIGTTTPAAKLSFAQDTTPAGGIDFGGDTNLYRVYTNTLQSDSEIWSTAKLGVNTTGASTIDLNTTNSAAVESFRFLLNNNVKHQFGNYTGNNDFFIDSYNSSAVKKTSLTLNADTLLFNIDPNNEGWKMTFGGDTNLYRGAANQLKTDDSMDISGSLHVNTYATVSASLALGTSNASAGFGNLDMSGNLNLAGALKVNGNAGTNNQVLTSTGTGVTWSDVNNLSNWQRTLGSLAPYHITDSLNLGSVSTSSATVHLAGTAGENSWINTGNFGLGTANPTSNLYLLGSTTGNLFTINDGTKDILNISSAQTTFNNPTSFTSSGDVSIAYNLNFTNPTLSLITSTAPLTFQVGETYNSSNLTLQTYNKGNVVINSEALTTSGSATISGSLKVAGNMNLVGSFQSNGNAGSPGQILSSTGTGTAWIAAPTGGSGTSLWQENASVLSPINLLDAVNLGNTATNSATVHLAGTTGDNSFVNTGNFGIGLINPTYKLDVTGDINLTGALRTSGNAGTNSQVLTSTGTGVAWVDQSTIGGVQYWQLNGGVLSPTDLNNDINLGSTSTASATVHLASQAGDNSFVNTGNFGIGDTTPAAALTVGNGDLFQVNSAGAIVAATGITNTGALTTSGGTANINNNSNFATNINTGTSTSTVNIGGGSGAVVVNSNTWDINAAGAASGLTGISTSGTVNLTGLTASRAVFTDSSKNLVSTGTSQNLIDSLSDETGSGYAVFNTAPTFATNITVPSVIGGIAANSSLILKSTSGTGTTDFISLNVGNNGGTEALRATSNGYVGIGTTTPSQMFQVGTGTGFLVNNNGAIMNANGATISGSLRLSSLNAGLLHTDTSGYVTSSAVNLAGSDVTGVLPLANGGTNNNNSTPYVSGKFLAYDGTKLASTAFDASSFEQALTFSNGLTRTLNSITLGGTLTGTTNINQSTFDMTYTGTGKFGIGTGTPTQKLDVAGFFVVDTNNYRVGIGTASPSAKLEIAGSTSTISNTSGDITLNAASGLFDFSGDSFTNFLNATASGQIKLGSFADAGRPATIGAGSLIYSTTQSNPQYYNGSTWQNLTNYFTRTASGILYPSNWYDSINLFASTGDGATSSAKIRLSGDVANNTFFVNPIAIGFTTAMAHPRGTLSTKLQVAGDILPSASGFNLGYSTYSWSDLYLTGAINNSSGVVIDVSNSRLTGSNTWNVTSKLRVGDTSAIPTGYNFWVTGNASVSGTFSTGGQVTVGGGAGKIDVGMVDPPYTINGQKYATYMASMVGAKEETVGKVTTTTADYIAGLGYRILLDLDQQTTGSDLWLFSQATNIQAHINDLSVLLTPEGQAKAWYEVDSANKILAIYSSTPASITYRLTAPRFDAANWKNTRTSSAIGLVINDASTYTNTASVFDTTVAPELIAQSDGTFTLKVNGQDNQEVSSFFSSLIANLQAGAAAITNLVADNLTVRTQLISPLANIDQLKTIDATVSGTLYADNIQGQTVDALHSQINLLDAKYASASAILADLQAKYGTYGELLGATSSATIGGSDPLALSPLATTSAVIPSDLALNSLNVHTLITNDLMANGSIFTQSISAFDTDLFIQPNGDKSVHLLANLMTLYPDGKVLINGDLLITGTIFAQGLNTQTATVSGTLAIGSSQIASESANFAQLTTNGLVIASGNEATASSASAQTNSNATIGVATIPAGSTGISILNTKVTPTTLIYVTPTSDTGGATLFVQSKTEGLGFTVSLAGAQTNTTDITFNYWLVETK